jgi:hypothetical protein
MYNIDHQSVADQQNMNWVLVKDAMWVLVVVDFGIL